MDAGLTAQAADAAQALIDALANKRKLVTIRIISDLIPIDGADAIEIAQVEGWKVVVKKGDFIVGDLCVYFEIDSFLPEGNPAWQFLVDKQPKMFNGVKGHKLRTIKLRGQISQGLVMPVHAIAAIDVAFAFENLQWSNLRIVGRERLETYVREKDFSDLVGVQKYEAALPACLAGLAAGLFPSFIRKTDQERCQNLNAQIFEFEPKRYYPCDWIDVTVSRPADGQNVLAKNAADQEWEEESFDNAEPLGTLTHWKPIEYRAARGMRDAGYEITMKLDGSSMTAYARMIDGEIEIGVCSRNLELKISDENKDNTFVRVLFDTCLNVALAAYVQKTGRGIAVQGEVMAPGIQGNREQLKAAELFVFDTYLIDEGRYESPMERADTFKFLQALAPTIKHVPIIDDCAALEELGLHTIDDLLKFAEGPSIKHPVREGLVFKRTDGQFSFKAISNKFLEKEKD